MKIEDIKNYIIFLKPFVAVSATAFFLAFSLGMLLAALYPPIIALFLEGFSDFVEPILSLSVWQIFLAIFLNNSFKALLSILFGVAFAVYPVILLAVNGLVIGILFFASLDNADVFFLSVLPHGVIEIPAIFLGTAIGIYIGSLAYKNVSKKEENPIVKNILLGLKFFIFFLVPVLLLAALIEVSVTPFLLDLYLGENF